MGFYMEPSDRLILDIVWKRADILFLSTCIKIGLSTVQLSQSVTIEAINQINKQFKRAIDLSL